MLLQPKMKHPIVKLLLSCIYSKTIFFTFSATDFMRTPFPCSQLNSVSSNMLHKTLLHIDSCGCVLCIDILYMKVINSSLRCSFLLIGLFLPYFFRSVFCIQFENLYDVCCCEGRTWMLNVDVAETPLKF